MTKKEFPPKCLPHSLSRCSTWDLGCPPRPLTKGFFPRPLLLEVDGNMKQRGLVETTVARGRPQRGQQDPPLHTLHAFAASSLSFLHPGPSTRSSPSENALPMAWKQRPARHRLHLQTLGLNLVLPKVCYIAHLVML